MTRPLSNDLRRRVVRAVVDGGMSRRSAAKRFGVAPSTAIKWGQRLAPHGQLAAEERRAATGARGGSKREPRWCLRSWTRPRT